MAPYRKYFAAAEAAERLRDEVLVDLRVIGQRYMALKRDLATAQGAWRSNDHFPDDVDTIERNRDTVYVSGTWSRRGCTDRESCTLPMGLVMGSTEEREAILADLAADVAVAKQEQQDRADAKQRQEFERLQGIYGEVRHEA